MLPSMAVCVLSGTIVLCCITESSVSIVLTWLTHLPIMTLSGDRLHIYNELLARRGEVVRF